MRPLRAVRPERGLRDLPRPRPGRRAPAALDPIFGALRAKGVEDKELAAADVVTWRSNRQAPVAQWARRGRGTWSARPCDVLVLNVLEPEECLAKERKRNSDPARHREKLMCYWGFSFEEACTGGASKYAEPVDCADAFCAVVRAGVGRHRLVLGGEVDCWDGEKAGLPGYVELKTTRVMDAHAQVARFERDKLLKWWAQSFAVGVRRILVGFRDDDGFVRKLQTLDTLKLPGYAARHAGAWDPKTALAFADKVLTDLKELFGSGRVPAGARVRLEYEPRRDKNEVRVVLDEAIPDFIPAEARRALARALRSAPPGAARPAAARARWQTPQRQPQHEPRQRRRGERRRRQRGRRQRGRRERGRRERRRPRQFPRRRDGRVREGFSGRRVPRAGSEAPHVRPDETLAPRRLAPRLGRRRERLREAARDGFRKIRRDEQRFVGRRAGLLREASRRHDTR